MEEESRPFGRVRVGESSQSQGRRRRRAQDEAGESQAPGVGQTPDGRPQGARTLSEVTAATCPLER